MRNVLLKSLLFLSLILIGVLGINASSEIVENKIKVFEIAEHQAFCAEIVPRKCLYVKREGKKQYQALWDEIENFKYIPGYKYVLRVEVENIQDPPKDTSGYKYYLKEIISRIKVTPDVFEDLYISKWYMTHIEGEKIAGGKPFIVFEKEGSRFYGDTSCNSMNGNYKFDGSKIEFSNIRQTKRACQYLQTVESPFTSIISNKNEISVEYDRLYFKNNGVVILEFKSNWED